MVRSTRPAPGDRDALDLSLEVARAIWVRNQALTEPSKTVVDAVRASGWLYSAGSTTPYVSICARVPRCRRPQIDAAIYQERTLVEVPAMRGCTMIVPSDDAPLARFSAQRAANEQRQQLVRRLTVNDADIQRLGDHICQALEEGALDSEQLTDLVPSTLIMDFGEEGRRLAVPNSLSLALYELQCHGFIERFPVEGRLDASRFAYRLLDAPSRRNAVVDLRALVSRFFTWAAPATTKELAWWLGVPQREVRDAMSATDLVRVRVEGWTGEVWVRPAQLEEAPPRRSTREPRVHLLPFRDNYLHLHRTLTPFVSAADARRRVLDWRNRATPVAELESLHHHAIVVDGLLSGIWEYDVERQEIAWSTFSDVSRSVRRAVEHQVTALESFIADDLGDVRFYAFDGGKARRARLTAVRKGWPS